MPSYRPAQADDNSKGGAACEVGNSHGSERLRDRPISASRKFGSVASDRFGSELGWLKLTLASGRPRVWLRVWREHARYAVSTPGRKGVLRVERALSPRTRGRGLIGGRVGYRRGNEKPSNLNGYGELWRKVFGPSGPVAFSCSEATRTSSWASSLRKVFTTCGGFNLSLFASLEGEPSGLLSAEGVYHPRWFRPSLVRTPREQALGCTYCGR